MPAIRLLAYAQFAVRQPSGFRTPHLLVALPDLKLLIVCVLFDLEPTKPLWAYCKLIRDFADTQEDAKH
jgi:hypothetical protein